MTDQHKSTGEASVVKQALLALEKAKARIQSLERERSEPIAIVGMACRLPGGSDSPKAYWDFLTKGKDGITDIPADRWDRAAWYDPDPASPGKMYTQRGGFIGDLDRFDAAFFGIAPPEARNLDPQQRLLLELSWEALENAGQPPDQLHSTAAGVFVGLMTNDYAQLAWQDARDINPYTGTGSTFSVAAGRLSYVLGLRGPSIAVDTACSSTLVAIHLACQSLRQRECEIAIAGGANRIIIPEPHVYMCKMGALSPDGRCWTFDERANGYARGEGGGVLILKRLSDALQAGDEIHAVIRGSAVNHDGQSAGLTAPSVEAQEEVLRRALAQAGVAPGDVTCIEAHGTGTPLGDPIEVTALQSVYAAQAADLSPAPCALASVKSSIGHLEAAAGAAAMIKMVLALKHGLIPAHTHFSTLNPKISLEGSRLYIPTEATPWTAERRIGGVSGFGFGGTNAHVIVERYAPQARPDGAASQAGTQDEQPSFVLPLSARSEKALVDLVANYKALARDEQNRPSLRDVARTLAVGRTHHTHRAAFVGKDWDEIRRQLTQHGQGTGPRRERSGPRARIAFVFSGQGSQWAGMGRRLLACEPVFRAAFEACDAHASRRLSWRLVDAVSAQGEASRLGSTEVAQPVIFALQYALACLWRSWGVLPDVLVGHSVGEIAAAVFSGALSMAQGMDLSIDRGRIMQAADGRGAMASVPLSRREVEEELGRVDGYVTVAAVNGPNTTVVAGDRAAVDGLIARLAKSGVACRDLGVGYAFHSAHMDAHAAEMGRVLHGLQPAPPHTPCHSTLTGGKADAQAFDADYWARQMRAPVLFAPAILDLLDGGVDAFLEIGPQPVLTPALADCMMERGREALILPSIRSREPEPLTLARSLAQLYEAGAPVDWRQAAREGAWVDLPAYPWDRQPYWLVPSHGGERALRSSVARASAPESSSTPLDTPQAPSAADASSDGHVLVQRWQALPGLPGDARALDGHWLLLGGSASWSEALAAEITARGASCTRAGSAPPDLLDAESVSRLMGDVLKAPGRLLKGIVYAPASHPGSAPDSAMAAVREVGQLLQAIARAGFRDPPRLWLTLSAGERTLAQGALEGLSKAIAHEHADLRCTLVELEAGEQAHVRLADELAAGSAEHQLSLRHGSRFAARLARRGLEGLEAMALSPDRAYIVTGGDAQVLDMADALADRGARQIIVASPVSLPARQIDQLRTRLDRLQTLQVDLASRAALQAGLDKLQAEGWPALHGSVHLHHAWIRTGAASALGGMTGPSAMQDAGRTGLAIEECLAGVPLAFSLFIHPALSLLGAPQQADGLAAAGTWAALAGRARAGGRAACALAWGEAKGEDGLPLSIGADGDAVTLADALEAALVLAGLPIDEAPLAGAMRLDVRRWRQLFPKVAALSLIRDLDASGAPARAAAGSGQLRRELEACAPKQRRALLERSLRDVLAKVALLDPDKIGTNVPLATLGLDSFMGVELRNRLENDLGLSLSPTLVYSYPTIADVATYLANRMGLKLEKSEDRHGSPTQGHAAGPDLTSISEENLLTTFEDEIAALEKSTRN